jgi:hypothetical protein
MHMISLTVPLRQQIRRGLLKLLPQIQNLEVVKTPACSVVKPFLCEPEKCPGDCVLAYIYSVYQIVYFRLVDFHRPVMCYSQENFSLGGFFLVQELPSHAEQAIKAAVVMQRKIRLLAEELETKSRH